MSDFESCGTPWDNCRQSRVFENQNYTVQDNAIFLIDNYYILMVSDVNNSQNIEYNQIYNDKFWVLIRLALKGRFNCRFYQ